MKKNKFLNGISAKLALAIVALTPAMFTSCEKESIEVDTTPVNAKLYIQPVVFTPDGTNVTSSATITFSDGSNGEYEGTTIEAKTVTVTATYNNTMSGSTVVTTPAVAAAHSYATTAPIFLAYESSAIETSLVSTSETTTELGTKEYIYDNPSDYWLTVPVSYTQEIGFTVISSEIYTADTNGAIAAEIEKYNTSSNEPITVSCYVGAHSRLIAYIDTETVTNTYNVIVKSRVSETVLATFTVKQTTTVLSERTSGDNEIPGHGHSPAGHGHGHGHGDDDNAGGGIVIAD